MVKKLLFFLVIAFILTGFHPLLALADNNFTASNVRYNPSTHQLTFDTDVDFTNTLLYTCTNIVNLNDTLAYFTCRQHGNLSCTPTHCVQTNLDQINDISGVTTVLIGVFNLKNTNHYHSQALSYPFPKFPFLSVPLLKQTDINWGLQVYDSADKWAPLHSTIADWGCALTSATMILQYHNVTKLPDGTALDPGTLNTWLKSQKDGYVDDGLVNWLAISRLTKLAKPQNPNFAFDALEYLRSGKDDSLLTQDLSNNQPDILEEPGHFIVSTGQTDNTFSINDPFYTQTDLSQGYNNTYLSMGRYIPSHTDLSYMMFVSDPSVHITLTDANNVSTGSSFLQSPLTGDQDPGLTSGDPINIFYAPHPHPGTYFLTLTGQPNQSYNVTAYLYDINGNSTDPIQLKGTFDTTGKSASIVTFDNQLVSNDQITPVITFETLLHDIDHLKDTNQIQKGTADALGALAKSASKSAQRQNIIPAKVQLFALQGILDVFHNRGVSDEAYKTLNFEVQYLLNSL